jgi:hypothetical protein
MLGRGERARAEAVKEGNKKQSKKSYLFLVKILKRRSQTRWWRQMVRQMVRLTCSYQHAIEPPNAIGGHTRRGATFRITYCAAAPAPAADTDSGTGK